MPTPSLLRREPEGAARAVVLMLHGGRADGLTPVDERSASWRRSHWMLRQIEGRLTGAGVAVWLLKYSVRGWNQRTSATPSPVLDARWALDQVRPAHADVPVVLLGHSMGARTAVAVADDAQVTGVVGLAPWLPASEPNRALTGRHLAVAHGRSDKITSFAQTAAFVERAVRVAASTELVDMGAVGHYMFRRISAWNAFAVSRSMAFAGISDLSRD